MEFEHETEIGGAMSAGIAYADTVWIERQVSSEREATHQAAPEAT